MHALSNKPVSAAASYKADITNTRKHDKRPLKRFLETLKRSFNDCVKSWENKTRTKELQKEVLMFTEGLRGPFRGIAQVFKGRVKAFTRA